MASEEVMLSGNHRNTTPLDLCVNLYVNRMSKVIIVLVLCISDKRVIHACAISHASHIKVSNEYLTHQVNCATN